MIKLKDTQFTLNNIATEYQKFYKTTCENNQDKKVLDAVYFMLYGKTIILYDDNSISLSKKGK